ncbi:MAG: hypothetical protein JKX93_08295 [Rhizobiaceae bacterium]|nr:hypothetical protein [Rhizobiaceae bacterium]
MQHKSEAILFRKTLNPDVVLVNTFELFICSTNPDWKAMPSSVHCVRLFADANGESHFGDIEIGMTENQYAPPAPTSTKNDGAKLRRFNLNLLFS